METVQIEKIITEKYDLLYYMALFIVKEPHDAEDAVQTACLKAWEHCYELLDESRYCSWLKSIVYHECMSLLRHRRRDGAVTSLEEADIKSGYGTSPDTLIGYWQLLDDIASMPRICQQAFMLRYDVGYSVQTIADLLSIPRGTVSSRLHRARNMLRRQLVMSDTQPMSMVS